MFDAPSFFTRTTFAARKWSAKPPGESGGGEPKSQEGPGNHQRSRPQECQMKRRGRGQGGADPHRPQVGGKAYAARAVLVADGFHSRSRVWVTSIRAAVRTMASRLKKAS